MKNEKSFNNGKIYQIVNDFSDDIYIQDTQAIRGEEDQDR